MGLSIDPFSALLPYPHVPVTRSESGPLAGLRLAVKDLFDVAGYPTGAGNPLLLAASGTKSKTAAAVQSLLDGGAEFVGKAKTDELAYSLLGINRHFGTPRNPRWPDLIPGGSSSGSAVAVAAGLADIGLGTDTSGSVRLPAAANGVFGWRSSHGVLSLEGCRPLAPSFDTVGILTRSVDVLFASMQAYGLSASPTPIRRLLVPRSLLALCEAGVRDPFERHLGACALPVTPIELLPDRDLEDAAAAFTTILQQEAWLSNADLFRDARDCLDPAIAERLASGEAIEGGMLKAAKRVRDVVAMRCRDLLEPGAAFCLPTLPMVPPRLDASLDSLHAFRTRSIRLLCLAGLSGCPQLSLPIPHPAGPLGLSLIGPRGCDCDLLGPARALLAKAGDQDEQLLHHPR